jgi:HSP20 family protein
MSITPNNDISHGINILRDMLLPVSSVVKDFDNYFSQESPTRSWEDDENIYLEANMPGFKQPDINIELHDNILKVFGRTLVRTTGGYQAKTVKYSFKVPGNTVQDNLAAKLEYGVLTISLPKSKNIAKVKRIQISQ